MSPYVSRKLMAAQNARPIDDDLHCRGCGYNMRGLKEGQRCPECGQVLIMDQGVGADVLTSGDVPTRRRWVLGFDLLILTLVGVLVEEVVFHAGWFGSLNWDIYAVRALFGLVLSIPWTIGVWLVTPIDIDERWAWVRPVRRAVRWSQVAWFPGFVFTALPMAMATGMDGLLLVITLIAHGIALLGVGLLAWLMSRIARFAELDSDEGRFSSMMFWVPALTLVVAAFPRSFVWMLLVFYVPFVVAWMWSLFMLGMGFRALRQHVKWAERHAYHQAERDSRIAATREAMEAENAERVRPTPAAGADISVHESS